MLTIGLYGTNGHQLPLVLPAGVRARVAAVAAYPAARLDETLGAETTARQAVREYASLDALLADPEIDLVSLCSPMRADQASDAIRCLDAGKHVLAEKPGAFSHAELDRLLAAEARTGKTFSEMMDGSFLETPVRAMRQLIAAGELGEVIHVQAQKSYPWLDTRPRAFAVDGGLIRQAGIHGVRFIIAATGLQVVEVSAVATNFGYPTSKDVHMAAVVTMTLANGALASLNCNYLNPKNFGAWGNEQLRVHGTRGMVESVDALTRNRLFLPDRESTDLPLPAPTPRYLEHYVNHLLDGTPLPFARADALNALRTVITAHEAAFTGMRMRVVEQQQ